MVLYGKGAAPGAAVGSVYIYNKKFNIPKENFVDSGKEQSELDRYNTIKKQALEEIEKIRLNMSETDPAKAEIFDAHKEIVEDIIINEEIPARILNERWSGDWAIYQVYGDVLNLLKKTPDPLIAERAADFDDIRALLLQLWYGQKPPDLSGLKEPVIIAAKELFPSDTAGLKKDKVLAIITEKGGVTSHSAIIAKSFGIPAILGIDGLLGAVKQGQLAAVNALEGTVILDPKEDVTNEIIAKNSILLRDMKDADNYLYREARTLCGEKIDIGLNVSNANDEELKAQNYTDSVGLFRTEFLYMEKDTLPTEEDQFLQYKKVLECYGKKPVVLRTLDIGGDKQAASLEQRQKREENPFLGNRGIRFCFSNPEIFKTQIRAALRASCFGNLWIMTPMIGSMDDIRKIAKIAEEAKKELDNSGVKTGDVKIGIMIEIPAIALIADIAVKEVDFASIGSNDLCQYMCASDRTNIAVDDYYSPLHPAIIRLIDGIAKTFNNEGKPLSVCGELGGDIQAIPLLIGLGIRKFSMGAASVAAVKRTISKVTVVECEELAKKALTLGTAAEIAELISKVKEH
ncbi:MAG: phosphoenolpyruvate--protein phosphotransferase [Treponema sp.]|nr:phosphoenolpyruvate--protein phosphotransferase [Treponema sp.]MCL2237300.1 phosphoenolpyruvate--protein phosphotransferase [Treponema sp.]